MVPLMLPSSVRSFMLVRLPLLGPNPASESEEVETNIAKQEGDGRTYISVGMVPVIIPSSTREVKLESVPL
jgi:hypothetical protein